MAGGYQGSFGPEQSDPLGRFAHWLWYGNHRGAGLGAVPGQLFQMFNPTTKAGAANLAASIFGGGDMPEGFAREMPGQFEPYSMAKSPVRMQEGQPHDVAELIRRTNLRASQPAAKMVHDLVFGGEVHAKGPIPSARLPFREIRQRAITERELNSMKSRQGVTERDRTAAELDSQQYAVHRMLAKRGLEPMRADRALGKLAGFKNNRTEASHYVHGEESHLVTPHEVHRDPTILHRLTGGHPLKANDARTAALKRLLGGRHMLN